MFNSIKGRINVFKETFSSAKKLAEQGFFSLPEESITNPIDSDIPVYVNDLLLKGNGIPCAMLTDYGVIIVDKKFTTLSENTKKFVLAHECGHFNLNHLEARNLKRQNIKRYFSMFLRVNELEQEADKYAVDILGKEIAIIALNEVKEKYKYQLNENEINKRIKLIESK